MFQLVGALVGESLREIAVLVIVFAPLDTLVQGKPLTVRAPVATMAFVAPLFGLGLFLQVKREWKH
jgi:hypothetical protein